MLESWSLLVHSFDHLPPRFPSQVAVLELEDRKCWIVIVYTAHLDVLFVCLFGLSREFKPKILLLAGNSVNKTWHPVLKNLSRFLGLSMAIVCVSYHLPKKPTNSGNAQKEGLRTLWKLGRWWGGNRSWGFSPKGVIGNKDGNRWMRGIFFLFVEMCICIYVYINIYFLYILILYLSWSSSSLCV